MKKREIIIGVALAGGAIIAVAREIGATSRRSDDAYRELQAEILALWERVLAIESAPAAARASGPTLGQRAAAAAARLGLPDD